jgi:S1-C subfamily serine protease
VGAYISNVVEGAPADRAGLVGSSGTRQLEGLIAPVGGDVVIEADGEPIEFFSDLLVSVAFKKVGESIELTILRDGEEMKLTVELAPRPDRL